MQLPSPGDLNGDVADSVVNDETLELMRREGKSTLVGEASRDSGSSVRAFGGESKESLEGEGGGRSSKASCSSN